MCEILYYDHAASHIAALYPVATVKASPRKPEQICSSLQERLWEKENGKQMSKAVYHANTVTIT
jgi:hypothetical protein